MKTFLYVLGTDPYHNRIGDYHTRGNGEWFTRAENVEEALKVIFNSMPFPGEPVGRKHFIKGISLENVHERDIIQVWSTDPVVADFTHKQIKNSRTAGLHDGHKHDFGLCLELKVTDICNYTKSYTALLAAPQSDNKTTDVVLSPMGASLLEFNEARHDMRLQIQREQMSVSRKKWEMEELEEGLEDQVRDMEQKISVLDTYLHGTRQRTQIATGKKGTGKYHVFQNRQFLSEEIALLGNFQDMDFQDLEKLEKWLVTSGQVWKFLPFERCILATRVRKDDKDYGSPLLNMITNIANMQNMIWIRDGENVFHVDVEFNFHNAIFPGKDQFKATLAVVHDSLWNSSFKPSEHVDWMGRKLKKGEYHVMGQMCKKPTEEEEPYCPRRIIRARFDSVDDWLKSDLYSEKLSKQIHEAVDEYLREVNRKQMVFAVLLQGIVDNTNLLEVPKGTDLFNWENVDQYFVLLSDYTHALPWDGISKKIEPYMNGKVKKGEWIVALVEEFIPVNEFGGKTYKEKDPVLFEVAKLDEAGKPVVNYHPKVRNRNRGRELYSGWNARVKNPVQVTLKESDFIRVPMSPSLAVQILDDRNWKSKNQWAVPIMVNYVAVLKAYNEKKNCTVLNFKKEDDE